MKSTQVKLNLMFFFFYFIMNDYLIQNEDTEELWIIREKYIFFYSWFSLLLPKLVS